MDKVAKELIKIAKLLVSFDFPTQDALDKYLKEHPDADKRLHKVVESKPEKTTKKLTKEEHTHKLENGPSVRIYDNGGETLDRYTAIIENPDWQTSAKPGYMPSLGLSEGGQAISQFGDAKEGEHLGKPIKWEDLDEATQKHIQSRLQNEEPEEKPKEVPLKKHGIHPVRKHTLDKLKLTMHSNNLTTDSTELGELADFKKTLGQRIPTADIGKYYVRNQTKLKKDFLTNMNPSNYESAEAFTSAKERIRKMSADDFGKLLAAINSDEDEEE